MTDNRCSRCGASAPLVAGGRNLGQAVVTLEGALPQAVSIFYLPEGTELLLCNKSRGDRYVFDMAEVIMRFLHCRQVAKSMSDVVVLQPEQEERLWLRVSVECEVEFYPDGIAGI